MSRIETFERDIDADRSIARLRLVGAVVVGISSVLLALSDGGAFRWIFVVLGGLASLAWVAAFWRGRKPPSGDTLELGPEGIRMRYKEQETFAPWSEVVRATADEDRLHVHVDLNEGELVIPLVWRGVGLHELAERVEAARLAVDSRNGDAQRPSSP
ncbi:MAG: hypothetical protein AB8H86_00820 [Polyangiales bacterium]